MLDAAPELVAFARGGHVVAVNAGQRPAPAPAHGEVLLATGLGAGAELAPGSALVARRD